MTWPVWAIARDGIKMESVVSVYLFKKVFKINCNCRITVKLWNCSASFDNFAQVTVSFLLTFLISLALQLRRFLVQESKNWNYRYFKESNIVPKILATSCEVYPFNLWNKKVLLFCILEFNFYNLSAPLKAFFYFSKKFSLCFYMDIMEPLQYL